MNNRKSECKGSRKDGSKKGQTQERAKVWERAREQERERAHEKVGSSKSRHKK